MIQRIIALLLTLLALVGSVYSQMLPITDEVLINRAQKVAQIKIVSKEIGWSQNPAFIFTIYQAKPLYAYKGNIDFTKNINIIVPGGYDPEKDLGMVVSDQVEFMIGEESIVFLSPAQGYVDGIDYEITKQLKNQGKDLFFVCGYFQGNRKIYTDKQLNIKMVHKPNENKSVEIQAHHHQLLKLLEITKE